MKASSILAAALLTVAAGQPAFAVSIFSDDFNRVISSTVGNGWTETETVAAAVSIVHVTGGATDNQLQLVGSAGNNTAIDELIAQLSISTVGFNNIALSFDSLSLTSGSSATLNAEWKLHSSATWTSLASITLSDNSLPLNGSGSLALGASAANALIDLRFFTNVVNGTPGNTQGAIVDNVLVSGTAITSETPILGALPLFATGAGMLGYLGRRRKKKAEVPAS
jgi:hypothetical protein